MRVWNRAKKYIGILLFLVCITACSKTDNTQSKNNVIEETQDEITDNSSKQVAEEREGSEDMMLAQQKYIYRGDAVLTKDNIEKTMKAFFQINDSCFFSKLETLPLTEKFFYECIENPENFPYVNEDDIEKMKQFELVFWGIREDGKCVCFCEFNRFSSAYRPEGSCYYVVMDLENEQIDSMEVTLVKKYTP